MIKTSSWELSLSVVYAVIFLGRHYFLLENTDFQTKKGYIVGGNDHLERYKEMGNRAQVYKRTTSHR